MIQDVSLWPLIIAARLQSQVSIRQICGGQWGSWGRFFSEYFGFHGSVKFQQCSIIIFIHTLLLPEGQMCEVGGRSKNQSSFVNGEALNRRLLPLFYSSLKSSDTALLPI